MLIDRGRVEVLRPVRPLILQNRAQEHLRVEGVRRAEPLDLRSEEPVLRAAIRLVQKLQAAAETQLQMIRRTDCGERLEVHAAPAAIVCEVNLLADPAVEADLRNELVDRHLFTEKETVNLEDPVARANVLQRVSPPVERPELSVGSESGREEPVQLLAVLQRVVLGHREKAHAAEESALRIESVSPFH